MSTSCSRPETPSAPSPSRTAPTELKDVRARVHFLPLGLLGGHVGDGTDDRALFRDGLPPSSSVAVEAVSSPWSLRELRQAEIEHLHQSVLVHHDVRRLQVAVNDAGAMRPGQGIGDLDGILQSLGESRIPLRGINSSSVLPATYSMAMKSMPSAWSMSWIVTMFG